MDISPIALELNKNYKLTLAILFFGLLTGVNLWAGENEGFFSVAGPCNLNFPADHGSHPGYRTEWWYYTGNLRSEDGNRYGFQLTFFRSQISPPEAVKDWPKPASQWRSQHVYLAHTAVSDLSRGNYLFNQTIARSAVGLAGVSQGKNGHTTVFLKNWSATIAPKFHHIKTSNESFSFDLRLIPVKQMILHGESGYSRKGNSPERASCYYSFTRLETRGILTLDNQTITVTGLSWMDHEFSTAPLEPGIIGWDWLSLIFSDRTELMVYVLRQQDGTMNQASSGTFIDRSGNSRHLTKEEFRVQVLDTWKSPHSGARYPAQWRLTVFPLSMELRITSNMPDQEMQTTESAAFTYWEGSVSTTGTTGNQPITGQGYVELTGYVKPFDAPVNKMAPYRFPYGGN